MSKDETIGKYCGGNNKSRITVKVAPEAGPPPSGEPRLSYDEQRELSRRRSQRREEYQALEESELRDLVLKQTRPNVVVGHGEATCQPQIRTSGLRKIHRNAEEHDVPISEEPKS
jgi:hypothetical protein